jgi:regulator of sigma E protease
MYILVFLVVLFVLVLVHELGHFLVAKRSGMRVDEFGIGFPPRLAGIRRGETLYSLNAIPLGGFVKIYGEDGTEESGPDTPRAFSNRPKVLQAAVLVAGVLANFLFAWLLFSLVFFIGTKTAVSEADATDRAALTVLNVLSDGPAARAGIVPGDMIIAITDPDSGAMPA